MDRDSHILQGFLGQSGAADSLVHRARRRRPPSRLRWACPHSPWAHGSGAQAHWDRSARTETGAGLALSGWPRSLRPLAAFMTPKESAERKRVEQLLMHAGYRSPNARTLFFGVKALADRVAAVCRLARLSVSSQRLSTTQLCLYAVAAGYLGSLLCSMWLDRAVESRQRAISAGFPDALDLLVVCVESGLGLAPALCSASPTSSRESSRARR